MEPHILQLPEQFTHHFIYLDCGAREEKNKPMLEAFFASHYIGFEPDEDECKKLTKLAGKGASFFPVAAGRRSETKFFYLTRNPGCSSLYEPNRRFFDLFMECGPFFDVLSTQQVQVVALDEYLPQQGINEIDFLEIDTQGSELDILAGAKNMVGNALGLKVEVAFAEMYHNQPMFSDVDTWLRQHGFMLFDLERYHLRRNSCPPAVDTREQIIWGQAYYLRDYRTISGRLQTRSQKICKLAVVASFLGFHSYAIETVEFLLGEPTLLSSPDKLILEQSFDTYKKSLRNNGNLVRWMRRLNHPRFGKIFHYLVAYLMRLHEAYVFVAKKQKYFWKD